MANKSVGDGLKRSLAADPDPSRWALSMSLAVSHKERHNGRLLEERLAPEETHPTGLGELTYLVSATQMLTAGCCLLPL